MKTATLEEVSDILDSFDLEEIMDLLKRQVNMHGEDVGIDRANYFQPLYAKYRSVMESEEIPGDLKTEATKRFNDICNLFIQMICKEFQLQIDPEYLTEHESLLPPLVSALYCFFIRDLVPNIEEVCVSYIDKNRKKIFEVFEERKTKKDAATLVNKRQFPIELAVILANIYDTSTWILRQMSEEAFVSYINPDYAPLKIIDNLMKEGVLTGEFMDVISEIYEENTSMRGEICLSILSVYKLA